MSIHRHALLLACIHASLVACASHPLPVQQPSAPPPSGPQAIEFEAAPRKPARATSLYAPTRNANSPHYSWQNATPRKCETAPAVKGPEAPLVLKFEGSVGVFPPMPDEVIDSQQAESSEALDTWGSGEPKAPESRSADFVVASLRPAFRHCFSRWLDAKADAEGSVRLALELGCAGDVQAISADVQGVDEPTLECLFTVVAPAQFGPPANGRATLQVPVVFKNASR